MRILAGINSRATGIGAVISVEQVTIAIASGDTITNVPLTKGQVAAKCVPFNSTRCTDDAAGASSTGRFEVSIWDNAGTPTVKFTRFSQPSLETCVVQIVEFGPDIEVQVLAHENATSAELTWTAACSAVDQSKAFVVLSNRDYEIGGLYQFEAMISTSWDSNTLLRFTRTTGTAMDKTGGLAYIIEDVSAGNDFFTVAEYQATTTSTATSVSITAVADVNKTWIITQGHTVFTAGQLYYGQYSAELLNTTTVRINKAINTHTNTVTVYVIEWQNNTTIQRGNRTFTTAATATLQSFNTAITTIDPNRSMVMMDCPDPYMSCWAPTTNSSWQYKPGRHTIELDVDGAGITWYCRGDVVAVTFQGCWQAIEFDLA